MYALQLIVHFNAIIPHVNHTLIYLFQVVKLRRHARQEQFPSLWVGAPHLDTQPFEVIPPPPVHIVERTVSSSRRYPSFPRLVRKDIVKTSDLIVAPHCWVDYSQGAKGIIIPREWLPHALEMFDEEILISKCERLHLV